MSSHHSYLNIGNSYCDPVSKRIEISAIRPSRDEMSEFIKIEGFAACIGLGSCWISISINMDDNLPKQTGMRNHALQLRQSPGADPAERTSHAQPIS